MCDEGLISSVHLLKADFLCESELTGKHLSGPTVIPHVPSREPRMYTLTTKFESMVWSNGEVVMKAVV